MNIIVTKTKKTHVALNLNDLEDAVTSHIFRYFNVDIPNRDRIKMKITVGNSMLNLTEKAVCLEVEFMEDL